MPISVCYLRILVLRLAAPSESKVSKAMEDAVVQKSWQCLDGIQLPAMRNTEYLAGEIMNYTISLQLCSV